MHLRVFCPLPEGFAKEPEDDTCQTEEQDQAHVCHDGRDITRFDDPRSDELRKAIAPYILIDCDGDEDRTCDRFVGVDGIC